ncbi:MAG: hypothetical protein RUDDFDWM_001786 [Candidatus Fervidibacterota bacterium]
MNLFDKLKMISIKMGHNTSCLIADEHMGEVNEAYYDRWVNGGYGEGLSGKNEDSFTTPF